MGPVFLGYDYGWWGFWAGLPLAFLSFIGVIALWVFGDSWSAGIRNWWSERSAATLRARIEKLEKQVTDWVENFELLSEGEDLRLRGNEVIVRLVVTVILLIPACAQVTVLAAKEEILGGQPLWQTDLTANQLPWESCLVGLAVYAAAYWVFLRVRNGYLKELSAFRRPRSAYSRLWAQKEIDGLRAKLEKMK